MAPLTFAETHNMIAFLSKKKVVVTEDIIRQDLRLDDADGVECFPNEEILVELALFINNQVDDLFSHNTKYTSPALTQKVFANMRRIGKEFSGIETPLFATMLVQPQATAEEEEAEDEVPAAPTPPSPITAPSPQQAQSVTPSLSPPQAQPAPPSSPPQAQLTTTSASDMTLLNTLMDTCTTLSHKVAALEQDKVAQALKIIKLEQRVKILEKKMRSKHYGLKRKYQNLKRKPISIAQAKKNMILYLKNMAGYKIAHFKGMTYDQIRPIFESFKKLRAEVEVSGSLSTQDTPTDDPKEMSEEDVKNMLQIIPVSEFKVKALQSFEDMLKYFNKEDLDALWRLTKENFSTTMPTEDKEKALWVELKRLYEPNTADVFWKLQRYMHDPLTWKLYTNYGVHQVLSTRRNNIFMFLEKDYLLTDVVLLLMLSTKLQVNEDCEIAKDLVMKTFMEVNKPKSRISLDTSPK
nr:hypothetical protein [Tanacetum cinerariifolium]